MKNRDIVIFSTADWDTPYWTNKQHTAVHLAKLGYRVLYVETVGIRPPSARSGRDLGRLWSRLLRGLRGPRKVQSGIWVLSPLTVPFGHGRALITRLNRMLLTAFIRFSLLLTGIHKPLLWTYHPYMLGVADSINHDKVVYHCVDDLTAIPGVDVQAFRSAERALLRQADVVFTTSEKLTKICQQDNANVHFMPNVVDYEHFSSARNIQSIPADLAAIPEPRIGYIGVLSDFKVDFQLIHDVALGKPGWHWVLIGEEREGQASPLVKQLRGMPNVHFLGYKRYDELPGYLAGIQVATLPTLINQYTDSMFPMKYYEYVSAGKKVVGTALAFAQAGELDINVASNAEEFIDCLQLALEKPDWTEQESIRLVGSNTWEQRIRRMFKLMTAKVSGEL